MDVNKILEDLKNKAAGIDPKTNKMPQGYFVSFRPIGLPIDPNDYSNPWSPTGSELNQATTSAMNQQSASSAGMPAGAAPTVDINSLIAAKVGQSELNYFQTFNLTDAKLTMDEKYSVMPDAGHVSDAWFAIINGAQEVASNMQLNQAMQNSIKAAQAVLIDPKTGNPTDHYNKYLNYQKAYFNAVQNLNGQYANAISDPNGMAMWPITGKIPQEQVNSAMENWVGLGYKVEIETAQDTLNAQGMDPAIALINRAKLAYENSLVEIGTLGLFPYTMITPSTFYDPYIQDGWTRYSQEDSSYNKTTSTSSSSESGSAGFSLGFFSIGATGGHDQSRSDLQIDTTGLKISFEYCTADINRPWLDTNLLNLGNWFLLDNPKNCISDGTYGQQLNAAPDKGTFLPSIVTSLILIRNLKIEWQMTHAQQQMFKESSSGGGVVGYGPFICGGTVTTSDGNTNDVGIANSQGIHVQGVQLVGYCSTITPASPRLDAKDYMVQTKNNLTNSNGQSTNGSAANTAQPSDSSASNTDQSATTVPSTNGESLVDNLINQH
ncbi:MAG: hypothetical protein ACXVAY_15500 [Mucilaginibacter sp.]